MSDKDSTLTIRLPKDLHFAFSRRLEENDEQASQVLRRAIRAYLAGVPTPVPVAQMPSVTDAPLSQQPAVEFVAPRPFVVAPDADNNALAGIRGMIGMDAFE